MRNKCLFALGVVFAMSLTSIVAFALQDIRARNAGKIIHQLENEKPTNKGTRTVREYAD